MFRLRLRRLGLPAANCATSPAPSSFRLSRRRASSSSSRRTATSARDHARWPELAADHAGWRAMRCRAARRRRPSVSRPRPRCPIGPLDSPLHIPPPRAPPACNLLRRRARSARTPRQRKRHRASTDGTSLRAEAQTTRLAAKNEKKRTSRVTPACLPPPLPRL